MSVAQSTSSETSRAQSEARAAVLASLQSAGSVYDSELQSRAANLHANEVAIARQEAELVKQTKALATDTAEWQKLAGSTEKQLKEFGDVQNWAEMIERDLLVVEETLRLAEGGMEEESASGGSRWR